MQVIFTKTIPGVASVGSAKSVKRGYFRNYLLPRGLAVLATPKLFEKYAKKREEETLKREEINSRAKETLERLAGKSFPLIAKVTKKGTLYRAITAQQIASTVTESAKVEIRKDNVIMDEPIKSVGTHEITLRLTPTVEAKISLEVSAGNS